MSSFKLFLMARVQHAPIVKRILPNELESQLDISATFVDGLTGMGGDIQFEHARRSASIGSIEIETTHRPSAATFSEGSTCARPERGHDCVANSANEYPDDATRWKYGASYRAADTKRHRAAAHVAHPSQGAEPVFRVIVRYRLGESLKYNSSWFAPAEYETDVSL